MVICTGNLYAYCDNNPANFCDAHGFEKDSVDGFKPSATKFWYYAIHYNHGKYVSGEGYVPHIHLVDKQTGIEYAINADKTSHDSKSCKYPDDKAMEVLKKDKKISKKWPPSDGPLSGGTGYSAFWPTSDGDSVADSGHAFSTIALGTLMQSQISGSASTYASYAYGASVYSFGYGTPQYATSVGSALQSAYWQVEAAVTGFFGFLDDKITECYLDDMGVPVF